MRATTRENSYKVKKNVFSLIETIMVLTMVGITLSIAIPSFKGHANDNQLRNNINDLSAALQFTRSQAIRLRRDVTICSSSDQSNCSSSNIWEQGWVIAYTDESDSRIILRVHDPLISGSLRSGGLSNASLLRFSNNGSLAQGQQAGTFVSCDDRGNQDARALIVNNLGFVHVAYDSNEDGIQNDHNGTNISCPNT